MTSCSVDNIVILQFWDKWMQIMQGIWMIGGPPQVLCSLLVEDRFVGIYGTVPKCIIYH